LYKYEEPNKEDYESLSKNELEFRLNEFISNLLRNDFERLCNLIYRHDVDETKFGQALQLETPEERSKEITRLVIDRELEKVKMRQMYKKYKEDRDSKKLENKD
jgi:hypothetical protein